MHKTLLFASALVFVLGNATLAQNQSIFLQGYVYYKNGRPISGATLQLPNFGQKATTDSLGIFILRASVGIASLHHSSLQPIPVSIASNHINFTVQKPITPVTIDLFEMNGRKCATLVKGFFSEGAYHVSIDKKTLSQKLYLIRATIGTTTRTLRMPQCNNSSTLAASHRTTPSNHPAQLSKVARIPQDTLIVESPEGAVKKVPLDTLYAEKPLLIVFENPAGEGSVSDDALTKFPVVTPVLHQSYFRGFTYRTLYQVVVPIEPEFTPEVLSYSASISNTDSIVCITPVARSPRAEVAVSLEGRPITLSPWYYDAGYISPAFYSCTLSTINVSKTFSAIVTPQNKSTSKTYTLKVTRN